MPLLTIVVYTGSISHVVIVRHLSDLSIGTAIPWQVVIQSGGSEVKTALGSLDLLELNANGAGSMFRVDLPEPTHVVPIRRGSPSPPDRLGVCRCLR